MAKHTPFVAIFKGVYLNARKLKSVRIQIKIVTVDGRNQHINVDNVSRQGGAFVTSVVTKCLWNQSPHPTQPLSLQSLKIMINVMN